MEWNKTPLTLLTTSCNGAGVSNPIFLGGGHKLNSPNRVYPILSKVNYCIMFTMQAILRIYYSFYCFKAILLCTISIQLVIITKVDHSTLPCILRKVNHFDWLLKEWYSSYIKFASVITLVACKQISNIGIRYFDHRIHTLFVRGTFTARLTSCLTVLDLTIQVNLLLLHHHQGSQIKANKRGGQPYSGTSL